MAGPSVDGRKEDDPEVCILIVESSTGGTVVCGLLAAVGGGAVGGAVELNGGAVVVFGGTVTLTDLTLGFALALGTIEGKSGTGPEGVVVDIGADALATSAANEQFRKSQA